MVNLVNADLENIVNIIETKLKEEKFNLKTQKRIFENVLKNKPKIFEAFRNEVQSFWNQFRAKNKNYVIKKTYTSFFYSRFQEIFGQYLSQFFGFDKTSLELKSKEKLSEKTLLLEFKYEISSYEVKLFNDLSDRIQDSFHGLEFFIGFLFYITSIFGMSIREILDRKIFIVLDGAIFNHHQDRTTLDFLIVVKEGKDEVYENYIKMALFYFLKKIKKTPKKFCNNLLEGRERLYQIAQENYKNVKEELANLLYYFYKKCKLLNNISPILDFLNFVGSRVEDSKFSKAEIIKSEFLANFEYTMEKKNSILRIFDFLDKKSSLYCTFQANNLPSAKLQLELFLLYMTYYFGSGLEALELGHLLYLPDVFKEALNEFNQADSHAPIGSKTISDINQFINFFSTLANSNYINFFFEKIFDRSVYDLNYWFFRTFLKSFNKKLRQIIEEENEILADNPHNSPLTFDNILGHTCRIIYTLIEKIFLKEDPEKASENFHDPHGRYIGKNIALRVLEIQMFQDINFSDDIWPEYLLTINKDHINEDIQEYEDFQIPEKHFYSTQDLVRFLITYNFKSSSIESYFEEWFIKFLINPLNEFILSIKNKVEDPENKIEVYEALIDYFMKDLDQQDEEKIKEIKNISQKLAPYWKLIA
ncbi:MAG: hypothetical protein R6U96_07605 [Promethearchaeia archaeon]